MKEQKYTALTKIHCWGGIIAPLPYYSYLNQKSNQATEAMKCKCCAVSCSIVPSLGNSLNTVTRILKNENRISEPHWYLGGKKRFHMKRRTWNGKLKVTVGKLLHSQKCSELWPAYQAKRLLFTY